MNRRYTLLVLLVCCLRLSEANASGLGVHSVTDEGTKATISRSVSQITIDGVLDEPDWKAAAPIGETRQREPNERKRATVTTEVKLLYDSRNRYVGVMFFDSFSNHFIATQSSVDAVLSADDC